MKNRETKITNVKLIDQKSVDQAFDQGAVRNIFVRKLSDRQWYFTFEAKDPLTGQLVLFTVETQRGGVRTWADPRVLFDFLEKRGVNSGNFILIEEI